jgi:hypothetical protein
VANLKELSWYSPGVTWVFPQVERLTMHESGPANFSPADREVTQKLVSPALSERKMCSSCV